MTTSIRAVYRKGVFEPLEQVDLREDQEVRLQVEQLTPSEWLDRLRPIHEAIIRRNGGLLPDSTPDIAEDRLRR